LKGCKEKPRHLFLGNPKKTKDAAEEGKKGEKKDLKGVRQDFYQTPTTLNLSLYVKGVKKGESGMKVQFEEGVMDVRLETEGGEVYEERVELYAEVDKGECKVKVLGTKVEVTLAKKAPGGWPVWRRGEEAPKGIILQVGGAGRA
jgi:HSP20 family molecular chaperone IbpA